MKPDINVSAFKTIINRKHKIKLLKQVKGNLHLRQQASRQKERRNLQTCLNYEVTEQNTSNMDMELQSGYV
ncbi:hypothetical protein EXN66_Car009225 [Channa argus]|uniref:Uncharacterized protein n=1 Tax=Channa argus TaxID=215402 RepID=A0A6G1PTJ3_CHAAH|nr:hypothetical protein EXN66_Car009225 [Channa argus]